VADSYRILAPKKLTALLDERTLTVGPQPPRHAGAAGPLWSRVDDVEGPVRPD